MEKLLKISLVVSVALSLSNATEISNHKDNEHSIKKLISSFGKIEEKNTSVVDGFKRMFIDGKVSGQIKSIYGSYEQKKVGEIDTYATAVGGILKYELASLEGFNAGFAFTTSQDVVFATGDKNKGKQNAELSSSSGDYTELSEAYVNYEYENFNVRAGRQIIDTPLADSDDIRMIQNTFEAYIATYKINGFEFMAGNLQRWQGSDAGLDNKWTKTGDNGTWLFGSTYASDVVDVNAWYYNVSKSVNALYGDVDLHYNINSDILIHSGVQYLNEQEISNSGIEADIYGVMAELSLYDFTIGVAYNKSDKKVAKQSFSGFGGGTMYTSMDTMIIDEIANDRDAQAFVFGLMYTLNDWNLLYSHGDFYGDADSKGTKAHVIEHDIGFEYNVNDELVIATIYVQERDEQNSAKTVNDWDRIQVMMKYNF